MTSSFRVVFIAVLALAGPAATAQPGEPDPFAIFSPQPFQAQAEEQALPDRPAALHLDAAAYNEHRAPQTRDALVTRWQVEQFDLEGNRLGSAARDLVLGDRYVHDRDDGAGKVYDFATGRILTFSENGVLNRPIAGHVHRQMDTYNRFTAGGTRDEIAGPGGAVFERFWIESAMGVRINPAILEPRQLDSGRMEAPRTPDGPPIFSWMPSETGTPEQIDLLRRWMRHTLPIHQDVLDPFAQAAHLPQSFEFLVFSPSSPDGRRERWTLQDSIPVARDFPWTSEAQAPAAAYSASAEPLTRMLETGIAAAAVPEDAPSEGDFLRFAQYFAQGGDLPGRYLSLVQASHHFGACTPSESVSEICRMTSGSLASGLGNQEFERLSAAVNGGLGNAETMLDTLTPYRSRGDHAGAAANLLSAQAYAVRGNRYDVQALEAFARAAELDPHAPLTYWHAGRFAASRGDIETAWLLFDIAQSLRAATADTALRDAAALEQRLRAVSPDFFAPDADG
ncbi:hypothetical protein [Maricaulis sp.]|uniref:hypothetical protein n=1 Tax=Maricaulis sp. TaxID=1486257 RepID=UPI00260B9B6B|nr:hypothetical protein [Maricaulis sp.]